MAWSKQARAASIAARRRRSKKLSPEQRFKQHEKFISDKMRKETVKLSIRAKRKKYGLSSTGNKRIAQKVKQGGTYYVPGQGVKAFSARPRLKRKRKK